MTVPLEIVRQFALSLPETSEAPHHQFSSFRVRGKIFVTLPPGDELLHLFLPDDQRELALAMDPDFLSPLVWGRKVLGVRAHLPSANREAIMALVRQAYEFKSRPTRAK